MIPFRYHILQAADLHKVLEIEQLSHPHPWTMQHFQDCLAASYWNYALLTEGPEPHIIGHCIVMPGVAELHLLNITVHPQYRRQQIARRALAALEQTGTEHRYEKMLLEVRVSNLPAIALYEALHYQQIGHRKDYYPQMQNNIMTREDAFVMAKTLG